MIGLTPKALYIAVPVLLGSVARLPMGMLTDRFGGRAMFGVLLPLSAAADSHALQEENTLQKAGTLGGKIVLKP